MSGSLQYPAGSFFFFIAHTCRARRGRSAGAVLNDFMSLERRMNCCARFAIIVKTGEEHVDTGERERRFTAGS